MVSHRWHARRRNWASRDGPHAYGPRLGLDARLRVPTHANCEPIRVRRPFTDSERSRTSSFRVSIVGIDFSSASTRWKGWRSKSRAVPSSTADFAEELSLRGTCCACSSRSPVDSSRSSSSASSSRLSSSGLIVRTSVVLVPRFSARFTWTNPRVQGNARHWADATPPPTVRA